MDRENNLKYMLAKIAEYIDDPTKGLPEEIFLFATQITPMINVDLLVRDKDGRILLSWRNDEYCGTGWHVPGGIIRYKESANHRIEQVALKELGCRVKHSDKPIEIMELISDNTARSHFITLVYECEIDGELFLEHQTCKKGEVGYLAWHDFFPEDMINVHYAYKNYFKER
ncbi:MAG: NUDIX domain-containing protein [Clostridium sp.]|nr:NUDIX domain-containing protein [Clostridium sp.]